MYTEDLMNLLKECNFTEKEVAFFMKGILKKTSRVLVELEKRLIIKFGKDDGKRIFDTIVNNGTDSVSYHHVYSMTLKDIIDECLYLMD